MEFGTHCFLSFVEDFGILLLMIMTVMKGVAKNDGKDTKKMDVVTRYAVWGCVSMQQQMV